MKTEITVFYPCYNQPNKLIHSLSSLRQQTFKEFQVILMDDCSVVDYSFVLNAFPDLSIKRIVNKFNLGALPNMLQCIQYPVETDFKIVFHEDDLLHPQWLEYAFNIIQQKKGKISWVASSMSFFKEEKKVSFTKDPIIPKYVESDLTTLVNFVVKGRALSFASVLYDTQYCNQISYDLDKYSVLGDRYILLELAKRFGFVYFDVEMVAAYDHSDKDLRWNNLQPLHIINYNLYLKSFFGTNELKHSEVISGFTRSIIANANLLPKKYIFSKWYVYWKMYLNHLFSFKYYLLSFDVIRKILTRLKY